MIRKVLLTSDTVGGVWNYSMDLCRELTKNGIEVALATMGRYLSETQKTEVGSIEGVRVFESKYKLEWMENPWDDVRQAGQWLHSLDTAFRPDVVHLNSYCFGSLPWSAPSVMVCHSCVCSWWESVRKEEIPDQWAEYRTRVGQGLRFADLVVAPTAAMLATSERLYGPFKGSMVIPNARDSANYMSGKKEEFVFSAGRFWDEAKNIGALKGAASKISWPIYAAGETRSEMEQGFNTLGHLSPTDIADWMSRAPIYALPAHYEPFGLSILEAALSGCALVLGDIPSLRENWSGCAIFVDPSDEKQLATALQKLIEDREMRKFLSNAARERALSFSTKKFGQAYLSAYQELSNSVPHSELEVSRT